MSEGEPTGGDDVFRFRYSDEVVAKTGFYGGVAGNVVGATDDGDHYDVQFTLRTDCLIAHTVTARFNWYEIDAVST